MRATKAIFRIIIGVIFGILSVIALTPALASFDYGDDGGQTTIIPLIMIAVSAILSFFAPTIRRSFGRGFLLTSICLFALPLSSMLLSSSVTSDLISEASANDQAATAVGSGIAGIAMTGAATVAGFSLGLIFLIIGLVLAFGGRREVIIVNQ